MVRVPNHGVTDLVHERRLLDARERGPHVLRRYAQVPVVARHGSGDAPTPHVSGAVELYALAVEVRPFPTPVLERRAEGALDARAEIGAGGANSASERTTIAVFRTNRVGPSVLHAAAESSSAGAERRSHAGEECVTHRGC